MKIEEIHSLWEVDSRIDPTELDTEALKVSQLQSKYMKIYTAERKELLIMETKLPHLRREKYEFFTQGPSDEHIKKGWKYPGGKILKNEANIYIDSDSDVIELTLKIAWQREKVDLLESIIRSLNNRGFQIKNAIDYLRWSQGG
jgi:hypothetical protein